jgi:hypothetical protein
MYVDIDDFSGAGGDMSFRSDQLCKAANVLKVQIGKLYYFKSFGIDLAYFIESEISFQNEVLQAHIAEKLSSNYLVISQYSTLIDQFFNIHAIKISNTGA